MNGASESELRMLATLRKMAAEGQLEEAKRKASYWCRERPRRVGIRRALARTVKGLHSHVLEES